MILNFQYDKSFKKIWKILFSRRQKTLQIKMYLCMRFP